MLLVTGVMLGVIRLHLPLQFLVAGTVKPVAVGVPKDIASLPIVGTNGVVALESPFSDVDGHSFTTVLTSFMFPLFCGTAMLIHIISP